MGCVSRTGQVMYLRYIRIYFGIQTRVDRFEHWFFYLRSHELRFAIAVSDLNCDSCIM